jgi:hypothetical protein
MAWDQESLWAKAKLFIERAFDQQEDDSQFGLWAALSMELLARSALAALPCLQNLSQTTATCFMR